MDAVLFLKGSGLTVAEVASALGSARERALAAAVSSLVERPCPRCDRASLVEHTSELGRAQAHCPSCNRYWPMSPSDESIIL